VQEQVLERYRELRDISEPPNWQDPELTDPQLSFQLAQIVPDHRASRRLDTAADAATRRRLDFRDEHPPHPAAAARDADADFRHGCFPPLPEPTLLLGKWECSLP
jgi:hypothetical protein